jgi:hypothetical protein
VLSSCLFVHGCSLLLLLFFLLFSLFHFSPSCLS